MYNCVLFHIFHDTLEHLIRRVEFLRNHNPNEYKHHKHTKLLLAILKVLDESLKEPESPRYLLGNTLGTNYRQWRRCKSGLPPRYRLFFRFSSEENICIYVWLNDEKTLRKEGSQTDVYVEFKRLIKRGIIPSDVIDILKQSVHWEKVEKMVNAIVA